LARPFHWQHDSTAALDYNPLKQAQEDARMNCSRFSILGLAGIGVIAALSSSQALAQQATDSASTRAAQSAPQPAASATSTTATATTDTESAEAAAAIAKANAAAGKASAGKSTDDAAFAKKAKEFGWSREMRHGAPVYCRETPVIGSRFTEKQCASETNLAVMLEQQQFQKDQFRQRACGGNCGG
jgi:hypothetical protein